MTDVLRPGGPDDLDALLEMAERAGHGLTNLPPDPAKLREKLLVSQASFARDGSAPADDRFMFVLEDDRTRALRGTCQIFARIGADWPFYSYRIDSFAQYSQALGRTVSSEHLTLCTDHSGASEVGGLFLNPGDRAGGAGALVARGRYLFIHAHRSRFADRIVADLRGVADEAGDSPFWNGVGGRFFAMTFREADLFNAVNGNQFIADLMPKKAIYTALLPDDARRALGCPHPSGEPAMRLLQREGFAFNRYVDIFDGGPTMVAATDALATIRDARHGPVARIGEPGAGATPSIVAAGRGAAFRACHALVAAGPDGIVVDQATAAALGVGVGDRVTHVAR